MKLLTKKGTSSEPESQDGMAILARYIGKKMKRTEPKKSRKTAKPVDEPSRSECSDTESEGSSCKDSFAK